MLKSTHADLDEIKYVSRRIRSSLKNKQDDHDQVNLEKACDKHSGQQGHQQSANILDHRMRELLSRRALSVQFHEVCHPKLDSKTGSSWISVRRIATNLQGSGQSHSKGKTRGISGTIGPTLDPHPTEMPNGQNHLASYHRWMLAI